MCIAAALCFAGAVHAEEVKGRWRFDLQVGGINPGGRIESQSGSVQILRGDVSAYPVLIFDPRDDASALNFAHLRGAGRIEAHAAYGLLSGRSFEGVLDLGLGFFQADLRGIEMSYSFDAVDLDYRGVGGETLLGCETRLALGQNGAAQLDGCVWYSQTAQETVYRGSPRAPTRSEIGDDSELDWFYELIEGGRVKAYPVTASLLFRFRPTKRFNPYLGVGAGYLFAQFEESDRWQQVADQLAGSLVSDAVRDPAKDTLMARALVDFDARAVDVNNDGTTDRVEVLELGHLLKRPEIITPDTPFAELRGGVELQFAPRWAVVAETKFFWAKRQISITADGKEQFGVPTPNETLAERSQSGALNPAAFPVGGLPAYIIYGGLRQPAYDARRPNSPAVTTGNDEWGQPGEYYLNGGRLKYGGWVFTIGLRYTL